MGPTTASAIPVTVVIPAFNRADYIVQAVESALAQQPVRPEQVLVIDDASTDETAELARAAGATVITLPENGGGARARAHGLAVAESDWIALLDSDDCWRQGHLAALWAARDGHVLVSSGSMACDAAGQPISYMGPIGGAPQVVRSPGELYPTNFISTSGAMVRRAVALEVGGFRTDLRWAEDLDLWLRVLEAGTAIVLPAPTVMYRMHGGQKVNDPGARDAQRRLLLSYSDRPWWTAAVLDRHLAVRAWDAMRAHLRERSFGAALAEGRWFARHPRRLLALRQLLLDRRSRRTAGAGYIAEWDG